MNCKNKTAGIFSVLSAILAFILFTGFQTAAKETTVFASPEIITYDQTSSREKKFIPVDPTKKHKITFSASTTGSTTVEANERVKTLFLRYIGNRVRFQFFDKNKKKFRNDRFDMLILSQKQRKYGRVFYPPSKAAFLKIMIQPEKGEKITFGDLELKTNLEGDEKKYLNVHPTFKYGDLNSYGFPCGGGGGFFTHPDGKTVWNTGFIGWSPYFPLKSAKFYKFFCKGEMSQRKGWIWINFYNVNGKKIKTSRINIGPKGVETTIKTPKGTAKSRLQCYYVIIEKFTVLPTKK